MKKAIVSAIQVGGIWEVHTLEQACRQYLAIIDSKGGYRPKMQFIIDLPDNNTKMITIRDEDNVTVAYGNFEGLPSFMDYVEREDNNV